MALLRHAFSHAQFNDAPVSLEQCGSQRRQAVKVQMPGVAGGPETGG